MIIPNKHNGYTRDGVRRVYFGGSRKAPTPQPTTTITETEPTVTNRTTVNEIPQYLTNASQDLIAKGAALTSRPYEAYTGPRVAEFSPLMNQAFERIGNQQVAGQIGEATGLASLAGQRAMDYGQFQQGVQQYMNPYMQNVVDIERRKAQEAADQQAAMLSGQAAKQGAFGGSGAALQQRALRRDTAQQLADIQAQGLNRAYESAVGQYNQGITSGLAAAGQLGGLGQQQFGQQMDITQGLGLAGDVQRQREQALMDVKYGDYLTAQKYPYEQLAFQQGLISGVPYSTTQRTNEVSAPGKSVSQQVAAKEQPSAASQLVGAGLTAYGMTNGGGTDDPYGVNQMNAAAGGEIKRYAVGGIASLNQPQLASMAESMSDNQLLALQQDPSQGPVTLAVVAQELLNRDRMRGAGIGQQALTAPKPTNTVVAEALGGGISDLSAPNLDNMDEVTAAGGGIVAFQEGGGTSQFMQDVYELPSRWNEWKERIREDDARKAAEAKQAQERRAAIDAARQKASFSNYLFGSPEREAEGKAELKALLETPATRTPVPAATPAAAAASSDTARELSKFQGKGPALSGISAALPPAAAAMAQSTPGTEQAAPTGGGAGVAPAGLSALKAQTASGMGDLKAQLEAVNKARTDAANAAVERAKAQEAELGEYGAEESKRLKLQEDALKGAEDKNFNMALIEAGLAMMSGTSANAFENIGKGALVGTKAYREGVERIQNRKEKLDEAVIALAKAKRSDKRVSQERMDRLEANVANAATANAEALYNFGSKALDMSREDARFATEVALKQAQIAASNRPSSEMQLIERIMKEEKIPFAAAIKRATELGAKPATPFSYKESYADYLKAMAGKTSLEPALTYEQYVRQFALPTSLPSNATVLPR